LVHLTERGLKPWYNKQKTNPLSPNAQKIRGTLLSEKFFSNINFNNKDDETLSNFTNSSEEEDDENYENECYKSIFSK
jgi:hypothetical protein